MFEHRIFQFNLLVPEWPKQGCETAPSHSRTVLGMLGQVVTLVKRCLTDTIKALKQL